MKKTKFLSIAVALAALSSCQSDDLDLAGGPVELASDGSEVFATIADVEDAAVTRAAFAVINGKASDQGIGQVALFEEGDQFKMYCSDTWKPQVYKFKELAGISAASGQGATAVFEYANEESVYNKQESEQNREYGVFPADMFKFDDEYRQTLVFKLPTENNYGSLTPTATDKSLSAGYDNIGAWHALVPMFGIYKPATQTVGFYYMTSLVRVQALGLTTGQQHTLTLTSQKYQLSGTFTTESFNSAEFDRETASGDDVPTFEQKELTEETEDASKSISITFTPTVSDVVLYIPLPAGTYEKNDLTLKLDDNDITETIKYRTGTNPNFVYTPLSEVEAETLTLGRGVTNTNLYAIVENNAAKEVASLKDINDLLKDLAENYDRNVTVDVKIAEAGIVVNDLESEKDEYRKLNVPELTHDVTLNISGKITAAEGKKLNIIGGGGTGTLTINYLYNDAQTDFAPIVIAENFANNVVLKANADEKGEKYVKFAGLTAENLTGNLTLEGMFAGVGTVKVGGTLTLKNYIHHIGKAWDTNTNAYTVTGFEAEKVNIEGDCTQMACDKSSDAANGNNPNAVVKKEANGVKRTLTFDLKDSEIAVEKGVEVYGITGAKKVTVGEGVEMGVVSAKTVTIAKDAKVGKAETTTSLSVTDAQVDNIVANGGTVTINAADKTVNTLTLGAPATINLNNGIINTISKTYEYTKGTTAVAKVSSTGKSVIRKVEDVGNWISFTSKWTGKKVTAIADTPQNAIYTATQFMSMSYGNGTCTLYTDVDLDNIEYTWYRTLAGTLQGVVRDDNSVTTIKNVTLKDYGTTNANRAIFTTTSSSGGAVTVKNIQIDGVTTNFTKDATNVGVLFGKVTKDTNIENVVVKNASLKGSAASSNIGGLIGTVEAGNVKVKNVQVKAEIEGYYNLGGVIGSVANGAEVTFGDGKNVEAEGVKAAGTTIKVIKNMEDNEKDTYAGKVGLAVGELNGKLSLQYFTATWTVDVNADWKYDKCRFFINDNTMVFKGCKNGSNMRYYVGYSPNAQELKLQEKDMVNGYDGTNYNSAGTFNIFEKLNNK